MAIENRTSIKLKTGEILGYATFIAAFLVFTLLKNLSHFRTWTIGILLIFSSFILLLPTDLLLKSINPLKRIHLKWFLYTLLIVLALAIYILK